MKIFQNINKRIGNKSRSGEWFRSQLISELGSPNFDIDFSDTFGFAPGHLYFYTYDAVTSSLPYYDTYPLTYVIEMRQNGFIGCNLHYVNLKYRDEIAKSLLNNSAQGAIDVPPKTLHKYLYTGVRGEPYRIPESEWVGVAQLPTERFVDMRGIVVPKHKVYSKN